MARLVGKGQRYEEGQATGIDTATIGLKTVAITFARAFKTTPTQIHVSIAEPTDGAAVYGGVFPSGPTTTGFNLNVRVTAAGAPGSTTKCNWRAYGR